MKHLKISVLALIVGMAIFFSVERLARGDMPAESIVDIQSFVYPLTLIAVVATIAFRFMWRLPSWVLLAGWLAAYIVGKTVLFTSRPVAGDVYTYLTLTEAGMLTISIWLARHVALGLSEFEQAIENISFGDKRVKPLTEAQVVIQKEIMRSRRHNRPLSVIVVEPQRQSVQNARHRMVEEVQQAMMSRYVVTSLGRLIDDELRRIDIVAQQGEPSRFIIICPETDERGIENVVKRIETVAKDFGVSVACGAAAFPQDALTFEELVRHAERHSRSAPEPSAPGAYIQPRTEKSV